MGLFDFLKPKQDKMQEMFGKMDAKIFPKGDKDKNAVIDTVLFILQNKISRDQAKSIALKSILISRISQDFNKERLKVHLEGYCINFFNEKQIAALYDYLSILNIANTLYEKTPSEIIRDGNTWLIPE